MADSKRSGADVGLLLLRLALGGIFVAHGVVKVLEGGPSVLADTLANLGLPQANILAYATIIGEIGGGLLVALGILPRLGALALAVIMGVAIAKVHLVNGFFLVTKATQENFASWPGQTDKIIPHGMEYNVALLAMSLAVFLAGGGAYSLVVGRKGKSK